MIVHTSKRKDPLTPAERSQRMSLVRSKNTQPEMRVRHLLWSLGYRYRLHVRDLPGCPDLVFRSRRKVIFIHGCFWHRHNCPMGNRTPKSRVEFWQEKLEGNRIRDAKIRSELKKRGWSVLTLWECETQPSKTLLLLSRVKAFLPN